MALDTNKLAALRRARGWSQAETARQAGLNQSYYSSLERQAKANPSVDVACKLAEAFGVPLTDLVDVPCGVDQ